MSVFELDLEILMLLVEDRSMMWGKTTIFIKKETNKKDFFFVLLTVRLSIFILVINQLDAQNFVLQ